MDSKLLNYAKSPIPVLNNSSPHNYVIMPALLAHIDSPISSTSTSSSQSPLNLSSFYTFSPPPQNLNTNKPKSIFQISNKPKDNSIINLHNPRTSKEIIYTTKRFQLSTDILNKCSDNFSNFNSKSNLTDNLDASSQLKLANNVVNLTNNSVGYANNLPGYRQNNNIYVEKSSSLKFTTNKSIDGDEFQKILIQSTEPRQSNIDSSILLDSSRLNEYNSSNSCIQSNFSTDSFVNDLHFSDNLLQEKELNINVNRNDYYSEEFFSESNQSQIVEHENNLENKIPNFNECLNISNKNDLHLSDDEQSLVTYTISCQPELELNLNRMVNCFVLMKDIKQNEIDYNEETHFSNCNFNLAQNNAIKLKCSVCNKCFPDVSDLLEHKNEIESCKENIRIKSEKQKKESKNVNRCNLFSSSANKNDNIYYEDEDLEDDSNDFESEDDFSINEEDEEEEEEEEEEGSNEINSDEVELISMNENEDVQLNKKNDQSLFNFEAFRKSRGNSLSKKSIILKHSTNAEMLINSLESSLNNLNDELFKNNSTENASDKQFKPRRKYNKNRTGPATNLTCESKKKKFLKKFIQNLLYFI